MIHIHGRLIRLAPLVVLGLVDALFMLQPPRNAEARQQAVQSTSTPDHDQATQTRGLETYGKLSLSFEANRGQLDPRVRFLSRGRGYSLFLGGDEAVLRLRRTSAVEPRQSGQGSPMLRSGPGPRLPANPDFLLPPAPRPDSPQTASTTLRLKLVGANRTAKVTGLDELPGKANYFFGKDPGKWHTNVPTYARVRCESVYPGIDLVYYGNQRQLEYDFVVAPGADPRSLAMAIDGDGLQRAGNQEALRIDNGGNLVIQSDGGEVQFHKPVIYQQASGSAHGTQRSHVDGHYVLLADKRVGFEVGPYDPNLPLVIDPVLSYSTYLGGIYFDEAINFATDPAGNAYVVGQTYSPDFPTTPGAYDISINATLDTFVTKLDPTGGTIVYSTYLGGSSLELGLGIAVDLGGSAYVTGLTLSDDFPTTQGAIQSVLGDSFPNCSLWGEQCGDAFVSKIDPTGSAVIYSTYLGGSLGEYPLGIAVDPAGNAYVTGSTDSSDFPRQNALQNICGGCADGFVDTFVTKLNPNGTALIYSTYLGGTDHDEGRGIATDFLGNAYVVGDTCSSDYPVSPDAIQPVNPSGCPAATVTKISPDGLSLVYSTYLGGSSEAVGNGIATDIFGNAYVTGGARAGFPTTPGAFQEQMNPSSANPRDVYVTKLNAAGSQLVYSTYVGGNGGDSNPHIAVDSAGNAYVTGMTGSTDFPTAAPIQTVNAGGYDAFVTSLNAAGSALLFSTYMGGDGEDWGRGIGLDRRGNIYLAGRTRSTNFPTANALQEISGGGSSDAFVAKISPSDILPAPTNSVSDLSSDVEPSSPDLISASLTSVPGGAAVTLSVRFATGTFNSETAQAIFNLDTDRNPFTGWPGVDSGNNDSGIMGTDYKVELGPDCRNGKAQILKYNSTTSQWDELPDQPGVTISPDGDGMDVTIPLSALGDPTAINFKVSSDAMLLPCDSFSGVLDYLPDLGLSPGIWTNITTPPPQPLDATPNEPAHLTYDFGPYNYLLDYTGLPDYAGLSLRITSLDTTQVEYQQRVAGTPYEGTTCAAFGGTGGYCEVFRVTCEGSNGTTVECPPNPNSYTVTINWNTQATIVNPGFLKAPLGTNDWENILSFFSQKRLDPDPTGVGRTKGSFSDFVSIQGVDGTPSASVTVKTPASNATYALNQKVYAQYSCSGTFLECVGTVDNGSRIDTDSGGNKSFGVNAVVSAGPTANKSVAYYVAKYGIGILFNPSVKSGLPLPIVLELRDDKGRDVSSRRIALKAQSIVPDAASVESVLKPSGFTKSPKDFLFIPWPDSNGRYAYAINTIGLKAGSYLLRFTVSADAGSTYSIPFRVK